MFYLSFKYREIALWFSGDANGITFRSNHSTLGMVPTSQLEKATFGTGCFWDSEAVFRRIDGVVSTTVGFMGGTMRDPTYEDICRGSTGHAEVVEVTFDPSKVSYEELLNVFWESHDSTVVHPEGPNGHSQYRSVIFYYTSKQEALARASMERLERSGRFNNPIATEIVPASAFYRADDHHQQFYEKCGQSYCALHHHDE